MTLGFFQNLRLPGLKLKNDSNLKLKPFLWSVLNILQCVFFISSEVILSQVWRVYERCSRRPSSLLLCVTFLCSDHFKQAEFATKCVACFNIFYL